MMQFDKKNIRTWSMLGSRRLFGIVLEELAERDDKFLFVTADVGRYYAINRFLDSHPDRVINVGIAEQNMIGIAAGLAKEGFHPMVATYATFATARVMDQVRVNMGLMQLGITVVGVSSGLAEGDMSATHMGLEDIAVMSSIPNITILSPADCVETVKCMLAAVESGKPCYVRLTGEANSPIVYRGDYDFKIGEYVQLVDGGDKAIIATGSMVATAMAVAKDNEKESGMHLDVINIHTLKPMGAAVLDKLCEYKEIITLEEHNVYGGLGALVALGLAGRAYRPRQLVLGVRDFYPKAARYTTLLAECGLSTERVKREVLNFLQEE